MAQEPAQVIRYDFQSDDLEVGTLHLAVPADARARFLQNPPHYIREFLERHGLEVTEVSIAVREGGASLEACLAMLALEQGDPEVTHLRRPASKRSNFIIK
jgi:hypothetical protein